MRAGTEIAATACLGKRRFESGKAARLEATSITRRSGKKKGQATNVYFCETCSGFHFGRAYSRKAGTLAGRSRRIFATYEEGAGAER